VWLSAQKGKGLEISGSWSLKNNVIHMEMTFSNKAMQAMQGFGIQLNKNSFGMIAAQPLNIPLLNANQTLDVSLPMTTTGPVQKMDPLTNIQVTMQTRFSQLTCIQVAIKNSIDIFYFACIAPLHIFWTEDGENL
jgi:AP-1 complex subunit beta-1